MKRDWARKDQYRTDRDQGKRGYAKILVVLSLVGLIAYWSYNFFFHAENPHDQEVEPETEIEMPAEVEQPPQKVFSPGRRKIYDRNLREMAVSLNVSSIFVKPLEFENIEKTVVSLAAVLGLDEKALLEELKTQRSFKWLAKNIFPAKAQEVAALNLKGVYFYEQEERFYPFGAGTTHIIGEVQDGHGLSGIEFYHDSLLSQRLQDGGGPDPDLVLTLDMEIQGLLDEAVRTMALEAVGEGPARFGDQVEVSALLIHIDSGEILAYSRVPLIHAGQVGGGRTGAEDFLGGVIDTGRLAILFELAAAYNSGQEPSGDALYEGREARLLQPRIRKKMLIEKKRSQWGIQPDGSYSSIWLAEILTDQDVQQLMPANEDFTMETFLAEVDTCKIDFPGRRGGAESGIGILTGFAALLNEGRIVCPHFLKTPLAERGENSEKEQEEQVKELVTAEASYRFVRLMQAAVQPERSAIVAEVLRSGGGGASVAGPGPDDEVPVMLKKKGLAMDSEEQEIPVLEKCSVRVLAAGPIEKPAFAMLLAMENGEVDLSRPSLFKSVAVSMFQSAEKIYSGNKSSRKPDPLSPEKIFTQWKQNQEKNHTGQRSDSSAMGESMVDLRGKSLRSALQFLNMHDVRVMVEGRGIVRHQHPAPGSSIKEGMVVILKGEADQ